jgi:GNAT superfamily N-acetyltransferase
VVIRRARADEGERLREIAVAAKGHWGYDPDVVRRWGATIDFSPDALRETYVAESDGRVVAWHRLDPREDVAWLADMWVEPEWIGQGVGSLLFRHALERASELGAKTMEWEAEPNAVGFYERVGGRYLRDSEPSEWGRVLPVMGVDIGSETNAQRQRPRSGRL